MAEQGFPVVGVGVSAGGIGALEALFRGLPAGCGMAFVVVAQFPDRESLLLQAIGRFAGMPVVMAEDGTRVRPVSVYVMAQGVSLTMESGMLVMRKALMREGHPVEAFFGSLAKKVGEYAVGVVFSGGEKRGEEVRFVNRIVEPWEASEPLYLVLFEASEQTKAEISGRHASLGLADPERELREVKGRLRSTIAGYEAELEALRRKMQALSAVNAELAFKLDRADSDLTGLFESSRVVTVFLDSNLAIRSFTPAAGAVFGFLPSDIGRPLSDLVGRLDYPELTQHLAAVLDTGEAIEHRFARGKTGTPYLVRLVPHRAGQGVVVTFTEANTSAEGEKQQGLLISELNHRVKNMLAVVISIVSLTGRQSEAKLLRRSVRFLSGGCRRWRGPTACCRGTTGRMPR